MKIFAWIVLASIIFVMFALLFYLLVGAIIFKFTFAKKKKNSRTYKKNFNKQVKEFDIDLCWWDKYKFEKVSLENREKMKLMGHFFDNNSQKTVIVVHGYGGTYLEMQPYCEFFKSKNFNILAVDNRAHGESDGKSIGFGWYDRLDILDWIEYLNNKNPNQKIVLFGVSMGATAVCCASGENLPSNVECVISDCAFANGEKQIKQVVAKNFKLGKIFIKHFTSFLKRVYGFDMAMVDATKQVRNTKIPILFIHGQEDRFVPVQNLFDLYNSTPEGLRDKLVVEEAEHCKSYMTAGVMYERKINTFLSRYTKI